MVDLSRQELLLLTDKSLAIKITSTHQNAFGYLTEVAPQINAVKKDFKKCIVYIDPYFIPQRINSKLIRDLDVKR